MIIVFYGNCQAMILRDIIQTELPDIQCHYICNYEYICSGKALPHDVLEKADVFVYQPLCNHGTYDTGHVIDHCLSKTCKTISFHYNYFLGYFPDNFTNERNEATKTEEYPFGMFPYGLQEISKLAEAGVSISNIIERALTHDFLSETVIREKLDYSIQTMRRYKVDVDVTDFILKNYARIRLFYTVNHLTNVLLEELVNGVLVRILGESKHTHVKVSDMPEFMAWQICPIYPCVKRTLNISFDTDDIVYKANRSPSSFQEFITDYVNVLHYGQ